MMPLPYQEPRFHCAAHLGRYVRGCVKPFPSIAESERTSRGYAWSWIQFKTLRNRSIASSTGVLFTAINLWNSCAFSEGLAFIGLDSPRSPLTLKPAHWLSPLQRLIQSHDVQLKGTAHYKDNSDPHLQSM